MKRFASFCRHSLVAMSLLLAGCAGLPAPIAKTPEPAFAAPETTALGKAAATAAPDTDTSGFRLLESGEDAFAALSGLINRAQRSLDLQYYLVRDDVSSRTLLRDVAAAAARGVRVRVLVDDFNTAGEEDALLCLAKQPHIEVRLYNPFPAGRFSTVSRLVASAADMQRISARMHNKQLIADSAMAITGGRNLGDAYFVHSKQANFLDLDLLVAGPVVRRLARAFDAFWNHELAYPIQTFVDRAPDCNRAEPTGDRALGKEADAAEPAAPSPAAQRLSASIKQGKPDLIWARSALLADKPTKTQSEGQPSPSETVSDDIERLLARAQREVLVISPYFVPGAKGMQLFDGLRRRGVKVRVLTNSLAATDAPAVHIGYSRYREALLAAGVGLYELRPQIGAPRSSVGNFGSSRSSLHAKALVIDRSLVLVGSMNMDPRSANLNSEMGLVVESPKIAAQLSDLFADMAAHSSYELRLYDGYRIKWRTEEDGKEVIYDDEPAASAGRRIMLWLITPFAPEAML